MRTQHECDKLLLIYNTFIRLVSLCSHNSIGWIANDECMIFFN